MTKASCRGNGELELGGGVCVLTSLDTTTAYHSKDNYPRELSYMYLGWILSSSLG